jgi:hypothetical protein
MPMLKSPQALWNTIVKNAKLKERLCDASRPERIRLLGKILREARDTDVWKLRKHAADV